MLRFLCFLLFKRRISARLIYHICALAPLREFCLIFYSVGLGSPPLINRRHLHCRGSHMAAAFDEEREFGGVEQRENCRLKLGGVGERLAIDFVDAIVDGQFRIGGRRALDDARQKNGAGFGLVFAP